MKNSLNLRPAFYDDEAAIIEIMNHGIIENTNAYIKPFDWIEGATWFKNLKNSANCLIVCELDERPVGWASLCDYRGGREALSKVKEITFYVHQDYRNQGVASKLIEYLEDECTHLGVEHLIAILVSQNLASKSLLEKHGYFVWGMIEGIVKFENHSTGHLYMAKHINTHR